jgi:hypothetical protein
MIRLNRPTISPAVDTCIGFVRRQLMKVARVDLIS